MIEPTIEISFRADEFKKSIFLAEKIISNALDIIKKQLSKVDGIHIKDNCYSPSCLIQVLNYSFGKDAANLEIYNEIKKLKKYEYICHRYYSISESLGTGVGICKALLKTNQELLEFSIFSNNEDGIYDTIIYGSSFDYKREINRILKNDFGDLFNPTDNGEEQ